MNEQALKDRLQAISKEKAIRFNECWKKLILERFLFRLSRSPYSKQFIFKGGFLLAYLMDIGRETTDLDFLLTKMDVSEKEISQAISEIVRAKSVDGFAFDYESTELLQQPHMEYPGYRVSLKAAFGQMKDRHQCDREHVFSRGDPLAALDGQSRHLDHGAFQFSPSQPLISHCARL